MTDPATRLAAFWALGDPPVRDLVFETAVAERIERRRLLIRTLEMAVFVVAGLSVAWAAWPFIARVVVDFAPILTVVAAVGLAVWSVEMIFDRLALGGYEDFTRDLASD